MPGTHDSATKYVRFKPICNTQNLTIEEQLQIGVRYLDMRFELKTAESSSPFTASRTAKRTRLEFRRPHRRRYCKYVRKFSQREPRRDNSVSAQGGRRRCGHRVVRRVLCAVHQGQRRALVSRKPHTRSRQSAREDSAARVVGVDALHFDDKTCGIDFSAYPYIGSRDIREFSPPRI